MEGISDAKRIGVELQTLLKIPPINKTNNAGNSNLNSGLGIIGILQKDRKSSEDNKPRSIVSVTTKEDKTEFKGNINSLHSSNISSTVRNSTQKNEKDEIMDKKNKKTVENERESPRRSSQNNGKSNNAAEEGTLLFTLRRPDCPLDLQRETEAFLEYARIERSGTQISPKLKTLLSGHFIELLSKKSSKFPKARFFCGHCNYHMDTVYACISHIMGVRHSTFELMKKLEYTLIHIPEPAEEHCTALGWFLTNIFNQYGLRDSEMERRRQYVNRLNDDLRKANIGCTLSLFGSSLTSLGFEDSDININVNIDEELNSSSAPKSAAVVAADNSDMLQKLFLFFQHHPGSSEVKKLVSSKSAKIHLRECENFCEVVVSMNNSAGVETAKLFNEYVKLIPLVRLLTVALRVWAKYCEVDNQEKGCLPPHSYAIMVIYYLQQQRLLPNLHIMQENRNANSTDDKSFMSAEECLAHWKCRFTHSHANFGLHWLAMLRFYAVEFNYKDAVVSISHHNVMRAEKYWNRKISIEDPIIPKSNLSRSMSNNRMCDYILERLKFTYMYFGIPRTIRGPLYDGILSPEHKNLCRTHIFHKVMRVGSNGPSSKSNALEKITNPKWDPISLIEEVKTVKYRGNAEFPMVEFSTQKVRMHEYVDNGHKDRTNVLADDVVSIHKIFPEWLYDYKFDTQILQNGLKPPIVCKSCGAEGHFKSDCPDEILPVLRPVMNVNTTSLRLLNDVLMNNYEKETLNSYDSGVRTQIVEELEAALLPIYPDAQLTMFGSTHNGFGVHLSDVDVCLTFRNKAAFKMEEMVEGDEETNAIVILRTIVEKLKSAGFLQEVVAIPSAKVPIVKFRHRASTLEGDISLYNTLAMYNTKLLRTYAELDVRVKILGCFLKKLTKLCDISDASRGSLSSYGYVLMAIHYFQHTSVPVLPVLQELCRDTLQPIFVDGCDVQYFKDLPNLKYVWPWYGQNRQSLAELWLGFLNYYTESFNFEEHVVTISQYNSLNRVYKFWLTDAIAIEDPFDRSHNLGAGLSRRMSIHILKTFHHLRQLFHASFDASMLRKHKDWLSYFTDPKLLQNGNPPLDRQCRICHKIGHIARNCTLNEKIEDDKPVDRPTPTLREVIEQTQAMRVDKGRNPPKMKTEADLEDCPSAPSISEAFIQTPCLRPLVHYGHGPSVTLSHEIPSIPRTSNNVAGFFGDDANPSPDDEILYRMISNSSAVETPGVEFVLQDEELDDSVCNPVQDHIKFGNHIENNIVFAPVEAYPASSHFAIPFNGMPISFNNPNSVRMRGYEAACAHNQSVTFMGPPTFQAANIQYIGNPNLSLQTATPPPPGFAPLPTAVPIVSHPTYIHPHVIPSHPFPVSIYQYPIMNPAHHQHEGGAHPGQISHLHPFQVFSHSMGPAFIRSCSESENISAIPNGDTGHLQLNHDSPPIPLTNGFQTDADRVCLPTMTPMSPIMTSCSFPQQQQQKQHPPAAQYPRVNEN